MKEGKEIPWREGAFLLAAMSGNSYIVLIQFGTQTDANPLWLFPKDPAFTPGFLRSGHLQFLPEALQRDVRVEEIRFN